MSQSRPIVGHVLWLFILFALCSAVTCIAFLVFVPGPDRGMTFYVAMSIVVTAELVLFAHLTHSRLAKAGAPTASAATRIQVHGLIFIWLILTIIAAVFAVRRDTADTFTADKILAIYLILTFVFFAATYFLYSRDIEIEKVDRELVSQRRRIQVNVPDIEQIIRAVDDLGQRHTEHALLCDKVSKKLDTLRSGIEGVLVSEQALENPQNEGQDWNLELERQISQLTSLSEGASTATAEQVSELLNKIASQAEAVIVTLRRREQSLMT